jgi:NitT/TauT family transport system ATP-binding protein
MLDTTRPRALVTLRDVGKIYANGTVALEGVDLEVRSGEILTLLGPSGCGKSTILRLVAGLDVPTSGSLERAESVEPGTVGYVFQDPTLMPWASVFDNVRLPLRLRGQAARAAREAIADVLERVGLAAFARAFPRELSGGMRMRVSIARALVSRPSLLLMDEPFAALDEITRFRLDDDLLALQADLGTTIVFVTHSVFESVYLSGRILVLAADPGRIGAEIVIDRPASERDESFRATPAYLHDCKRATDALHAAANGRVRR